jgi:hypothetical protein
MDPAGRLELSITARGVRVHGIGRRDADPATGTRTGGPRSFAAEVLVGAGIPRSGLPREGRFDEHTRESLFPPVKDKGSIPSARAATWRRPRLMR